MPAVLKAIQSWEVVMASNALSATATIPVPVDPAKSFLYISWRTLQNSGNIGGAYGVTGWISVTGTQVSLERHHQPSTDAVTITVTVVEFTSGVSVQRGVVNGVTSSTADVSITTVDLSKSWAMCFQKGDSSWSVGGSQMFKANLQSASLLRLRNNETSTNNSCRWEVVQHDDATVQAFDGMQADGVALTNIAITTVDMSKTFLVGSYASLSTVTDLARVSAWWLESETNVRHARHTGTENNWYSIFVVSISSGCTVQRGAKPLISAVLTATAPLSAIDLAKSLIITGSPANCFHRTTENHVPQKIYPVQTWLTSEPRINFQRNFATAPAGVIVYWQVISFDSARLPDMSMFLTAMH